MKKILCSLFVLVRAFAAEPSPLDQPVGPLRFEKAPLPAALRTLSRAVKVTLQAEPELVGDVTVDFPGGTLRNALATMVEPAGLHFEETPGGIMVRQRRTVLYSIDYPQLTRSGSGSASITLGGASHGGTGNYPAGTTTSHPVNGGTANTGSDATQVSISQENQNTFWTTLEAELRTMLKDGDSLVLNRFSGVAQVAAPVRRHLPARRPACLCRWRAAYSTTGRRTVTDRPGSALRMFSCPSCACATRRHRYKPSPTPPVVRWRAVSGR